ncbi:MAG TPA: LytTR family DNA-binding domain-containing protein [Chitinophagaceae bacterium]
MKCLIVDDNEIARATMRQLAGQVSGLVVAADCATAMEAYNFLQQQTVDLLLLDIEMPGMNGLELTKNLGEKRPLIIFTTSKKDYAVEAFELNVVDYILKPVTPARFIQAIERAREISKSNKEEVTVSDDEFIFIRDSTVIRRLQLDEILYAEAMGDYVKLHTAQRYYAVHSTLKTVEERLPSSKFIRVHRSYIAGLGRIDSIQDGVLIIQGKPVPVADAYRAALNKRMNIL